jgi:hypothetical protein
MKLSVAVGLSIVASLAILAPAAMAAGNASKPITYIIDPTKPDGEKICTDQGGTVKTKPDGTKTCTLPAGKLPPVGAMREPTN